MTKEQLTLKYCAELTDGMDLHGKDWILPALVSHIRHLADVRHHAKLSEAETMEVVRAWFTRRTQP